MTDKSAKTAVKRSAGASPAKRRTTAARRVTTGRGKSRASSPDHAAIAERAYFIHLEEDQTDPVANWLRAERELTPA